MSDDPLHQLEADAEARGIPVSKVLRAAGVAPSTFWRWRKSKFEPRPATLRKLRQSLDELARAAA